MINRSTMFGCAAAVLLAGCGGSTSGGTGGTGGSSSSSSSGSGGGGTGGGGTGATGGAGGSGGGPLAWVGDWVETGTQATTCAGATTTTQLQGFVTISLGSASGTLDSLADNCTLTSHVTGDMATLTAGQMCTVMVNGASVTATWTMGSSTLNGNIIVGTAAGTTSGCSFTQQSTLTRM